MTNFDSKIEWTDTTWNFVTGCTKVSSGCDLCYAERITERFHGKGSFAEVKLHPGRISAPLHWRKPRRVFVNSMSDLFHDSVPDDLIAHAWALMGATPRHTYQILTKRHGRMRSLLSNPAFRRKSEPWQVAGDNVVEDPGWPLPNVHLGVSVEDQKWADIRIPALLDTPAAVRFLSCEPLLGPVDLRRWTLDWDEDEQDYLCQAHGLQECLQLPECRGLQWLIVGGESGDKARPCDPDWIRPLVKQCQDARVPVFVKQLGSVWARENGWSDKGGLPERWPEDLRIREFPVVA